jgi:hypothetical protein
VVSEAAPLRQVSLAFEKVIFLLGVVLYIVFGSAAERKWLVREFELQIY